MVTSNALSAELQLLLEAVEPSTPVPIVVRLHKPRPGDEPCRSYAIVVPASDVWKLAKDPNVLSVSHAVSVTVL